MIIDSSDYRPIPPPPPLAAPAECPAAGAADGACAGGCPLSRLRCSLKEVGKGRVILSVAEGSPTASS